MSQFTKTMMSAIKTNQSAITEPVRRNVLSYHVRASLVLNVVFDFEKSMFVYPDFVMQISNPQMGHTPVAT